MIFKSKMSTEEYQLPEIGLTAYVRTRYEGGVSRLDVSLYEYGVECPELGIYRQMIDGAVTGEHLAKAYSRLMDVKKCEEQWTNWKNIKEVK